MTRKLITHSLGALSLLLSTCAYAQSNRANVPFAFSAGNVELPAGDYLFQQKSENHFISIYDMKSGKQFFAAASDAEALPADATAKLIFHRYGNQHYLAAVWTGGGGPARTFSTSGEEMQWRSRLLAMNPTAKTTQEEVALK